MNAQRLLLYSSKWQALRVGWLGEYSKDGGWTTETGTQRALAEMRAYLDEAPSGSPEKFARYWRVINCLNAVRMGYSGQGVAGSLRDDRVREFRDEIQPRYRHMQQAYGKLDFGVLGIATVDEWGAITAAEFEELPLLAQIQIEHNLTQRAKLHAGREELEWFLSLIKVSV